jgi:ribosomal protein S15P/S13E
MLKDTRMPDLDLDPLYKKAEEVLKHLAERYKDKAPKHFNRMNINDAD